MLANPCPKAYYVYVERFVLFVASRLFRLETVCAKSDSPFTLKRKLFLVGFIIVTIISHFDYKHVLFLAFGL